MTDHPLDVLLAGVLLDAHPRELACVGCGCVTIHRFARDEWDRVVLVRWYGCAACGMLRSVDAVPLGKGEPTADELGGEG